MREKCEAAFFILHLDPVTVRTKIWLHGSKTHEGVLPISVVLKKGRGLKGVNELKDGLEDEGREGMACILFYEVNLMMVRYCNLQFCDLYLKGIDEILKL